MKTDIRFYDTSSLLIKGETLFKDNEPFVISSITLQELESIKTSAYKDDETKYRARVITNLLVKNRGKYLVHIFTENMLQPIVEKNLSINNDMKILATAIDYNDHVRIDEVIFVTNDACLSELANLFFGDGMIESVDFEDDDYTGIVDFTCPDEQTMADFYSHEFDIDCLDNQYLILRNPEGQIIDRLVRNGETWRQVNFTSFSSNHFGVIKPLQGDIEQQFVADSFMHNKITMIKGPAGTGKTLLSLGFLFSLLERHKIDKIIIFCNTVAVKGAAKLGYLPGTREEKLLDSQIGNLLISKIGSRFEVEKLIEEEQLILLPLSDIRGYDTSGMKAGIYISEAQNLDISMMKLALQRIGEDSICIIDGDEKTQVDDIAFAGVNNGMRRASKVFRGTDIYGEITLKQIHRSKIARIAEQM